MASVSVPNHIANPHELNLLLVYPPRRSLRSWAAIVLVSAVAQTLLFLLMMQIATVPDSEPERRTVILHRTPLYLPPQLLTQREPNRIRPANDVSLADLLARQAIAAKAASAGGRHFQPPKVETKKPNRAPQIQPPPELAANTGPVQLPPGAASGSPLAPLPSPSDSRPLGSTEAQAPVIRMPHASVQSAIQSLAQNPASRRTIVSDAGPSRPMPGMPAANGQTASQHVEVELKSDAEAPDFRNYLAQILAVVRANWRRVTPESVRMGTIRGENTIELIINRDGSIPKLVIGDPSNVEALDRASVAGVSMSNPLPSLPDDFKGEQVRVTFTFKYNMPE